MRLQKKLLVAVFAALAIWGIEALWIIQENRSMPSRIKRRAQADRRTLTVQFRDRESKLNAAYDAEKYLASGRTVYDRIFNTHEQTVVELIQRMADESIPEGWDSDVRVDEFTHFILLIQLPHGTPPVSAEVVASRLIPVVKYCDFCMFDAAVFDRAHKCYLFFDNGTLQHFVKAGTLTSVLMEKVKRQGSSFSRFNSQTIQCERHEGHLFVPMQITGSSGVETSWALFDTGASVTMAPRDVISKTGSDNLVATPKRRFSTVNGWMSCPVVHREVAVGGLHKRVEVAVNMNDELAILGMNFFQGLRYIVDSQAACIHVWEEGAAGIPRLEGSVRQDDSSNTKAQPSGDDLQNGSESKETSTETARNSEDGSSLDFNDLATLADRWLELPADSSELKED